MTRLIESFTRTDMAFPFAHTAAEPTSAVQPLVLILDADADARFMMRTMLEFWDYRVTDGDASEDSITLAENARPDLILLDIPLEYMNGIKLLRRIQGSPVLGDVPVIFFSGHAQPVFRPVILALGGSDFFVKPLDFDCLRESLEKHIGGGVTA